MTCEFNKIITLNNKIASHLYAINVQYVDAYIL